ncbi:MAG: methylenetetrahydrofolate reductase C-terminal domain-containing protein [Candidatus Brocadiia bacterium]
MIVLKQKPLEWIAERLAPFRKVMVVGCGTCSTVCFAGGEREVEELCCALQLALGETDADVELEGATCKRLCDAEFLEPLLESLRRADAVLSLGCGAGTNLLADTLESVPVLPGVDTSFLGANAGPESWSEMCAACGECILDLTFGICPVARCAKTLLNGPCGGSSDGKCEVNPDTECAWAKIVERAQALGRLEELERVIPPKDWSSARHGGPRSLQRDDLGLRRLTTEELDEV